MNSYIKNKSRLKHMSEQESFWDNGSFLVVTDKTKPAMIWTAQELRRRGKKVYVLDLSDRPDEGSITEVSGLPAEIDCAIIGVTRRDPADVIEQIKNMGIKKFWIHWRTDTARARKLCQQAEVQCITGRCPMMYLAPGGLNMHSMHRAVAKIFNKY